MAVRFVPAEEAWRRSDVVLVGSAKAVPNPWVEAVKGVLHVKRIPFVATYTNYDDPAFMEWVGNRGAPVIYHDGHAPLDRWNDILLFAERLSSDVPLLPDDAEERAITIGLCHEIAGEQGLGWARRLDLVHRALAGHGHAFADFAVGLGAKYGYRPADGPRYERRVCDLLAMLSRRLKDARARGSDYYVGDALTAADIYAATFLVQFGALPNEQCAMLEPLRRDFEGMSASVEAALDPALFEHRELVYRDHLELPLSL